MGHQSPSVPSKASSIAAKAASVPSETPTIAPEASAVASESASAIAAIPIGKTGKLGSVAIVAREVSVGVAVREAMSLRNAHDT